MYKISHLIHTADVGIRIQAESLEALFTGALDGMNNLVKKNYCRSNTYFPLQEPVQLSAPDTTSLLIDFLSAVLTISHINKAVYCCVAFHTLKAQKLEGTVWGKAVPHFDEDIKAVTYHEADVKQTDSGLWETNVLFDI